MSAPRDPEPEPDPADWQVALDEWERAREEQARPLAPPEGWWEEAFADHPNPSERRGHRCGERQMLILVSYDISDSKRLQRVAKHCEDHGTRIQYSVFELRLEAGAFDRFWEDLVALIDEDEDRITAYRVCVSCAREVRDAGAQTHSEKVVAYVF